MGGGTGSMLRRAINWELFHSGHFSYTLLDTSQEAIDAAKGHFLTWAESQGMHITLKPKGSLLLEKDSSQFQINFLCQNVYSFFKNPCKSTCWDLIFAHAFLDIVDLDAILPGYFDCLAPKGLFYTTLNFDGVTQLLPETNPILGPQLLRYYHASMIRQGLDGTRFDGSHTGQRLFNYFQKNRIPILAAGASDWVVFPRNGRYPANEAYFLRFILRTIQNELLSQPEIDPKEFQQWVKAKEEQIESAELTLITHQLDFLVKNPN